MSLPGQVGFDDTIAYRDSGPGQCERCKEWPLPVPEPTVNAGRA